MLVKHNKLFDNNLMYQQSHNYDYAIRQELSYVSVKIISYLKRPCIRLIKIYIHE